MNYGKYTLIQLTRGVGKTEKNRETWKEKIEKEKSGRKEEGQ